MGQKANFNDDYHTKTREMSKNYYYNNGGKKIHRLRYLMKCNNINKEALTEYDNIDQKIKYCEIEHIKRKYGNIF